ncbi:hypothetical protein FRC03_009300 [Tulasnella sp. 419]|nr:hypothetical protein FRC03_009300 [Tulasnella sp. 419]
MQIFSPGKDGRKLRYNWLILASGTKWEGPLDVPFTESEAVTWLNEWRSTTAAAQDIVVGGGGSLGIELAGEIKHFYPNTNVTLVHAGHALISDIYPMKVRTFTLNALQDAGVNVILDDKVDVPREPYSSVTTRKGRTIRADLMIPSRGGRPNTAFIKTLDPLF